MDVNTLNDLLECSVCLERLDTTSRVLPCQHTFCRKCLEVIVASHTQLRCPECRVLVDIKIDELPPNVLLMRILEGMKNATANQPAQIAADLAVTNDAHKPHPASHHIAVHPAHANHHASHVTLTEPNGVCDNGNASGAHNREHMKRMVQNGGHENGAKPSQEHSNGVKPAECTAPMHRTLAAQVAAIPPQNNKQLPPQHCGSSLTAPCAKALYDFESKEAGDLSFKKGDKIMLKRRIDPNWCVGEFNGREGVFPINYVQILIALPQPQCKALYDFRMGPNEEEGCLTFKKGDIISVLRRVDQNWAEGRIGDTIGIFPILFVEMNALAKHLIDVNKYIHYTMNLRNVPPTPVDQPNAFPNESTGPTVAASPNSSATSNSTSNTAPNSPITSNQQLPTANSAISHAPNPSVSHDKRYPYSAGGGAQASNATNAPMDQARPQREAKASAALQANGKPKEAPQKSSRSADTADSRTNKSSASKMHQKRRQYSPSTVAQVSAMLIPANAFVALYPYKPQKSDELELKKGSVYYVKERCQDGWFKGINRSQKSGVFPGNYVTPLRSIHTDAAGSAASTASNQHRRTAHSQSSSAGHSASHKNGKSDKGPPELPPRLIASSTPAPSSSSSVWSKPIGQHVEALFGRSQSSSTVNLIKRITNMKRSKSPSTQPSYSMDNPVFEDNTVAPNEVAATPSPSTVAATTTVPATTASSSKLITVHLSHPVHVRSGSLPIEIGLGTAANASGMIRKTDLFASHRLKAHKERPALQGIRQNMEANIRPRNGEPPSQPYHRKSQSMDAATIAAQITANADAVLSKRKSYTHNEKFKCIVPYPPNSEFELELAIGDIVFVHKKRDNGWFKGTHARSGKVGLFPSSFVEAEN